MTKLSKQAKKLPNIVEATADFEKWLGRHITIVRSDLELKHQHMAEAAFPFFRATFYRWAQLWPVVCEELSEAPHVLAIGDLHVENFGTWRDLEGRLIWGVNDFDEAWPAAYTVDLVRLTASAFLAIDAEHLSVTRREAREAIEQGYRDAIAKGGGPFVLAEQHRWLRLLASSKLRDPVQFWAKIEACPKCSERPPKPVLQLLHSSLPLRAPKYENRRRIAGLGSLGHPRFLSVANWHGARLVREGKELRPSAWVWAEKKLKSELLNEKLINTALRVRDPHVHFRGTWQVRRLGPDCCHVELASLPAERDEAKLLYYMGWETANIHLGSTRAVPRLKKDLGRRRGKWLQKAAKAMCKATLEDWKDWQRGWKRSAKKR
jgi:Uncharacterized protein conserved in bacteria (DUF2252)